MVPTIKSKFSQSFYRNSSKILQMFEGCSMKLLEIMITVQKKIAYPCTGLENCLLDEIAGSGQVFKTILKLIWP